MSLNIVFPITFWCQMSGNKIKPEQLCVCKKTHFQNICKGLSAVKCQTVKNCVCFVTEEKSHSLT